MFTEKLGKVSTLAKGARKGKSKLLPLSLPFCFGEYVLFRGKSLYTVNEGEIINSFQSLLNSLDTLTYASYICELVDIAMVEEESNRELFRDFVSAFILMQNEAVDFDLLLRAFEIRILISSGYYLNLENCTICGRKINTSNYVSLEHLGGVCSECEKSRGIGISFASYNTLRYLLKTPLENIYKLSITNDTKQDLEKLLSNLLSDCFGRRPNSLETLNFIKGVE